MRELCRLGDIADGEARGFELDDPARPGFFIVRKGDAVYGYVNDCPHWRVSLDFVPGRFMSREGDTILCANHGARFRIEDGTCVSGPCAGEALTPLPVRVIDDVIVMDLAETAAAVGEISAG